MNAKERSLHSRDARVLWLLQQIWQGVVSISLGGNPSTDEEHEEVKKAGGLLVIGTERHDARRIDNQLRGRAGRQGDPGETQFFVSLEDSLMRIFASDAIKTMMGRFGIPEDEPIENRMITKALESAQTKIEGFNFDARKHVLQYDNIISLHRKTMYARRRKLLLGTEEEVKEYLIIYWVQSFRVKKTPEKKIFMLHEMRRSRQSVKKPFTTLFVVWRSRQMICFGLIILSSWIMLARR